MLLPILKYPHKRLKDRSKPVTQVDSKIGDFIDNMFETMYVANGIGLAAPQVDERLRIIVIDVPIQDPLHPDNVLSDPLALINPEIISGEGTLQYEEGCLSCPELIVKVDRLAQIKVAYLDREGKLCHLDAEGLKGVCIQHEIDHLNGELLVDKVSRLERDLYKSKRIRMAQDEDDLKTVL